VVSTPDARSSKPSKSSPLSDLSIFLGEGEIYRTALTHRSYAFEQPHPIVHNERLEFLGDAILGAIVTDHIFTSYPDLTEGEMARLRASVVNTHALAEMARELELGEHIRVGKGELSSGGRDKPSLLADTFEALIGALYLDRGMEHTTDVLVPLFEPRIRERIEAGGRYDAKTALQEVVVRDRGGFPAYRVASSGPDHDKHFTAHVYVDTELYGVGDGRSKKEAEQNAAREALGRIEEEIAELAASEATEVRDTDARAS
jgi:ribonuclease III